jgi:hypothetical protein
LTIKGTVSRVYEKPWAGKDGNVVLHSFQIQGDNRYFRTGTNKIVSNGEAISFDIEGNNNVLESSLSKLEREVQAAPPVQSNGYRPNNAYAAKAKGPSENFEARQQYWTNKEARDIEVVEPRITWSSARTAAVEVIGLALQHDALAFGNASKGAKLGMILDYIDEVSARFYNQSMNAAGAAENATEKAAQKTDKAGKGKEKVDSDND